MTNSGFEDYFKLQHGAPMAGCCADLHSLGYVYVIGFEEEGIVKIGSARNPGMRLNELQCGNPFELKLLAVVSIYEGSPVLIECAAHKLAREDHIRGEWFALTAERAVRHIIRAARNQKAKFGSYHQAYEAAIGTKEDHESREQERRRVMRVKLGMD